MSSVIVDLTAQRGGAALLGPLQHPAGVKLPFEGPSDAALIIPEIRSDVRSGAYSADMVARLPEAVKPGDRVLVIGAGLGIISTLLAKTEGVERVIAVEANTTLVPYLNRVHEANGVPEVETVNAVLSENKQGRVPFFARRDLRMSSLLPHDRSWQQVMMVPFMNLNLILAEERISLIVCDIPVSAAQLVAEAELDQVERVLVNCAEEASGCWDEGGACALLIQSGFVPEPAGGAILFNRPPGYVKPAAPEDNDEIAGDLDADDLDDEEIEDDLVDEDLAGEVEAGEEDFGEDAQADAGASEDDLDAEALAEPEAEPVDDAAMAERDSDAKPAPETGPEAEQPSRPAAEIIEGAVPEASTEAPEIETEWEIDTPLAAQHPLPADDHFASLFEDLPEEKAGMAGAGPAPAGGEPGVEPAAAAPVSGGGSGLLLLAILAFALALPLIAISELAGSRAERHAAAAAQTVADWGGAQTLIGPYMVVPVEKAGAAAPPVILLPERLEVTSTLDAALRQEDVFQMPVYRGRHSILLDFDPALAAGARVDRLLGADEVLRWEDARLGLGITETKALRAEPLLTRGGGAIAFESGSGVAGVAGIHAPIGDPRGDLRGWSFSLDLDGSGGFRLTPAGRVTEGLIDASWSRIGIGARADGSFEPDMAQRGATGMTSRWFVPQLAHSLPRSFRGSDGLDALAAADFGVTLSATADLYLGIQRAAKLGFLIVIVSFAVLFLIARLENRRPHPVQYALVGLAQCLFLILLLPLAETIGLISGFGLTALVTIGLLTAYAWWGMGLGPRSLWLGVVLAGLYWVMYVVLTGTGSLLLAAAALAFVVLAAAMWFTRGEPESSGWGAWLSTARPERN
ncbi:MAG: inner membrane CreD family protein [Paracoccaceae bacterium]|nr:inner membrane CreD family protein [Paracoccaceae bacterium]